jgi:hypothetical protein
MPRDNLLCNNGADDEAYYYYRYLFSNSIKSVPILQLALLMSFLAVILIGTCGRNDTRGISRFSVPTTVALPY